MLRFTGPGYEARCGQAGPGPSGKLASVRPGPESRVEPPRARAPPGPAKPAEGSRVRWLRQSCPTEEGPLLSLRDLSLLEFAPSQF